MKKLSLLLVFCYAHVMFASHLSSHRCCFSEPNTHNIKIYRLWEAIRKTTEYRGHILNRIIADQYGYVEVFKWELNQFSINTSVKINDIKDSEGNTPLHYLLLQECNRPLELMAREVYNLAKKSCLDLNIQNDAGFTLLMLAAKNGYTALLKDMLETNISQMQAVPANFAIKNRQNGNKTILDYAAGNPEIEKMITEYDAKYKKLIAKQVIEHSNLLVELSKIVGEYATPVNSEDIEADKAYEKEIQEKQSKNKIKKIERLCVEFDDMGLPLGYSRNLE